MLRIDLRVGDVKVSETIYNHFYNRICLITS